MQAFSGITIWLHSCRWCIWQLSGGTKFIRQRGTAATQRRLHNRSAGRPAGKSTVLRWNDERPYLLISTLALLFSHKEVRLPTARIYKQFYVWNRTLRVQKLLGSRIFSTAATFLTGKEHKRGTTNSGCTSGWRKPSKRTRQWANNCS